MVLIRLNMCSEMCTNVHPVTRKRRLLSTFSLNFQQLSKIDIYIVGAIVTSRRLKGRAVRLCRNDGSSTVVLDL